MCWPWRRNKRRHYTDAPNYPKKPTSRKNKSFSCWGRDIESAFIKDNTVGLRTDIDLADNGKIAIESSKKHDIVLMDLQMPDERVWSYLIYPWYTKI
jgi:hypothetical protein